MRRATAALLGTVTGTARLVGAKYTAPQAAGGHTATADVGAGAGDNGDDNPSANDGSPGPSGAGVSAAPGAPGASASTTPGAVRTSAGKTTTTTPGTGTTTTTTASCKTVSGTATTIVSPGTGTATVTIKVCAGAITTASAALSASNWSANTQAIPSLNSLTIQYYKTDITKIHYSGATLTSNAYQTSLRSAMSKAGI